MRTFFTDADRWNWYGAGDQAIAPRPVAKAIPTNAPDRVAYEIGLVLAIPLLLAVLAYALPA